MKTAILLASLVTLPLFGPTLEAQPLRLPPDPVTATPVLQAQPPSLVTRLDPPAPTPAETAAAGHTLVSEVEKMIQSGADASVIKSYIQSWNQVYSVSADEILHLHDIGASTEILTTLIQRGAQLQAKATPMPPPSAVPGGNEYPEMGTTNAPPYLYPYPSDSGAYTYSYMYPNASYPLLPNYYYSYAYPYSYYYGYPYWPYSFSFYYGSPYRYGHYWGYHPYGYYGRGYYGRPGFYGHGGYYGGAFRGGHYGGGFRGGYGGGFRGGFGHGRR